MSRVAGRVVAITGASAGIGRSLALTLAARGARVAALARRLDRLDQVAAEVQALPGELITVGGDVTDEADVEAFVARTVDHFGRIDVMVCNAGIGYHGRVDDTPAAVTRRLMDVNVIGTIHAARSALVAMRLQGHGHIIAISSIVARRGVEGSSVYGASKAAQLGFIESLRAEFVGTPFQASVVFPVRTVTEFHEAIARDFSQAVEGHGPAQTADDVARAIVRCIERPRAEVYPYPPARLLALLNVIAPALTDRVVRRFRRSSRRASS